MPIKFRLNDIENIISIGSYPDSTLAQVRRIRDQAKLKLKDGIHPNKAKTQKNDK